MRAASETLARTKCQIDFAGGSKPVMIELEVYAAQ